VAENWKNAFTTWLIWDFLYVVYFFRHRKELPAQAQRQIWLDVVLGYGVIAVMAWFLPWETLFLWLIPSRFSLWMICLTFMYLPHYPHGVAAKDNPYQATTIRVGHEWLLSPLLVCQNYHLVHHLYPTVPFYRYRRVWLARKDFHEAQNPAVVRAFGMRPRVSSCT
jgi:fatty acid desaturase